MTHHIIWRKADGSVIACHEKVKVLNENYQELKTLLQDVIDDALLLGCSEAEIRNAIQQCVNQLQPQVLEQDDKTSQ